MDSRIDYSRPIQELGKGAYGKVYLVIERKDGKEKRSIAKKAICRPYNPFSENLNERVSIPQEILREISILNALDHPNIIKLYKVSFEENLISLYMEFMEINLRSYLHNAKSVHPELARSYLYQLLQGVKYCHDKQIIHRDLKPENLLVDREGRLKIIDFGLACSIRSKSYMSSNVVTRGYRAPELLLHLENYSTPIDLWSVGAIFVELLSQHRLISTDSEFEDVQLISIFEIFGAPTIPSLTESVYYNPDWNRYKAQDLSTYFSELGTPVNDASALDLLKKFFLYDPSARITAGDALKHPYFSGFVFPIYA